VELRKLASSTLARDRHASASEDIYCLKTTRFAVWEQVSMMDRLNAMSVADLVSLVRDKGE
jgi:hypothetical protein